MGSLRTGEGRLQSGRAGLLSKRADDGLAGLREAGAPRTTAAAGACTQPRLCLILASGSRLPCFLLFNMTMKGSGGKLGGLGSSGKCCHTKHSFPFCEFCYYQQDAAWQSCSRWSEESFMGNCIWASLFVSAVFIFKWSLLESGHHIQSVLQRESLKRESCSVSCICENNWDSAAFTKAEFRYYGIVFPSSWSWWHKVT